MPSHLEGSDSTRDFDTATSHQSKPRDFIRYNHKDDTCLPHTSSQQERLELNATLSQNKAELSKLQEKFNAIPGEYRTLADAVKQKKALTLKRELNSFLAALKSPDDGLMMDTDPLNNKLGKSKQLLEKLKTEGVNIQELESCLHPICSRVKAIDAVLNAYKRGKQCLSGYKESVDNYRKNYPKAFSRLKKHVVEEKTLQIKNDEQFSQVMTNIRTYMHIEDSSGQSLKEIDVTADPTKRAQLLQDRLDSTTSSLRLCPVAFAYQLKLAASEFQDFSTKIQNKIEEQAGQLEPKLDAKAINLKIAALDKEINTILDTLMGPKRSKKQTQAGRIEEATNLAEVKQIREINEAILKIQRKNGALEERIGQLEAQIGQSNGDDRYSQKAAESVFKDHRDHIDLISVGGIKSIKRYLERLSKGK